MPLAPGTRVGVYEVVGPLGAGGMGEVYRARDTTLGRDVALKVLSPVFSHDEARVARFSREARALAALNHPNIAAIYALEPIADGHALVLELVDGETLAARIARGALPMPEAIDTARAIAEALDAAHEQGIVHRDLKPGNVMLTRTGGVKVLDFGLAKVGAEAESQDLSRSPTVLDAATQSGVILGTAAYMSPEQARGLTVDKRTDIWAFGCVLFETLVGRPAFSGPTVTDTLAGILEREPDWALLPGSVPEPVREILRRCLSKDPRSRARDIGDVLHVLQADHSSARAGAMRATPSRRTSLATMAVSALLAAGAGWTFGRAAWSDRELRVSPVVRTQIELPSGHKLAPMERSYPLALSSDGSRLAFVAQHEGGSQLFVRELHASEARPLAGTAGARQPFFSPDGRWIAYFTGRTLERVSVDGGAPIRICELTGIISGGVWTPDGTIVVGAGRDGLLKVGASGGTPERLTESGMAGWPDVLPDGRVLYTTGEPYPGKAFATITLAGTDKRIIARVSGAPGDAPAVLGGVDVAQARYSQTGHLVYGQDPGAVRVLPFDLASMTITGPPASLVDSLERGAGAGAVYFAVSQTALLTFVPTGDQHQLVWVDRQGLETPISPDRAAFRIPHVSPDGRRIAVSINDEARRSDIWIYDAERGTRTRLTAEGHNLESPWTPDGTKVTFSGQSGIEEVNVEGTHVRMPLKAHGPVYPGNWAPDGQVLLLNSTGARGRDLLTFRRGESPRPLLERPFNESQGRISPDGRRVAYASDESGRYEVYVERFPDLGDRVSVSLDGGTHPRWARNGRELFFRQGDSLMVAAVESGRTFRAERPRRLFAGAYTGTAQDSSYDVAADGRRFVMVKSDEASTRRHISIVQNWPSLLGDQGRTKN